jgi:hypothetical protein
MQVLLALALSAAAAPAPIEEPVTIHFSLGLGLGTAYGGVGGQGQLRGDHFGVYLGVGPLARIASGASDASGTTLCGGLRWYEGAFFVSLNGSSGDFSYHYDPGVSYSPLLKGSYSTLTATIGGRWRLSVLFIEAGIGAGVARMEEPAPGGYDPIRPPPTRPAISVDGIPDLSLALGLEF